MKNLKILLDAAHGKNIAGKRSPDSTHIEYIWSRQIIDKVYVRLNQLGYETIKLIVEDIDPKDHLKRIQVHTTQPKTLLISFHNNAAACGTWERARGYSIYTSKGQTNSDKFATILYNKFRKNLKDVPHRQDLSDGDPDWEANFNVLVLKPIAVLIEWLFQDNIQDVQLLKNDTINNLFIDSVVEAVNDFNELMK